MNQSEKIAVACLMSLTWLWVAVLALRKWRQARKEIAWLTSAIATITTLQKRLSTSRDKTERLSNLAVLLAAMRSLNVPSWAVDGGVPGIRRWSPRTFGTRMSLLKAYYLHGIEHAELQDDSGEFERLQKEARRAFSSAPELYPSLFVDSEVIAVAVQPKRIYYLAPVLAGLVLIAGLCAVLRLLSVRWVVAIPIAVVAACALGDLTRRFLQRSVSEIADEELMAQKLKSIDPMVKKFRKLGTVDRKQSIKFIDQLLQKMRCLGLYDPEMGDHPERWRERGNWSENGFALLLTGIQMYYAFWGLREQIKRAAGAADHFEKVADEAHRFFAGREQLLPDIFTSDPSEG